MIQFSCPSCDKNVRVPDSAVGKKGKCKHCQNVITVPKVEPELEIMEKPSKPEKTKNLFSLDWNWVSFSAGATAGFLIGAISLFLVLNDHSREIQDSVVDAPASFKQDAEYQKAVQLAEQKRRKKTSAAGGFVHLELIARENHLAWNSNQPNIYVTSKEAVKELRGSFTVAEIYEMKKKRTAKPETVEQLIENVLLSVRLEANQVCIDLLAKAMGETNFVDIPSQRKDHVSSIPANSMSDIEYNTFGKIVIKNIEYDWGASIKLNSETKKWKLDYLYIGQDGKHTEIDTSFIEVSCKTIESQYML